MRLARLLCTLALLLLPATAVFAQQTGKIAGAVTDASGETLPGVNVLIEGTTQGAVTDIDGYYFINNVRPGTYSLRASFVGFTPQVVNNVHVSTGLTTEINFQLQEEAVGLDELVVTSERPIVQLDVSANVANLSAQEFVNLPVSGVNEMIDLQAGVEPGLQVRGGGTDQLAFVVDGMNLRTGRSNQPFTNISYTALEEVQVQTGGFNAEYGNVRSGIVNVATKDPSRTSYTLDGMFRYQPIQEKSASSLVGLDDAFNKGYCDFASGNVSHDCDSWYLRPALDPTTSMAGSSAWDPYTQQQYLQFDGWEAIATRLQDKGFDVTPGDMMNYFRATHKKDNSITKPDYEADFTVGGPVPGISKALGDLRFLASYRGTQTSYTLPQSRDAFKQNTFQGKLISNVATGMKLSINAMYGDEKGSNVSRNNPQSIPWRGNLPAYPWSDLRGDNGEPVEPVVGLSRRGVFTFSDGGLSNADVKHLMLGANFTHTLNANTFYEVTLQNLSSTWRSDFPNLRDGSSIDANGNFNPVAWTDNAGAVIPGFENNVTCFGGGSDINGDGENVGYCIGNAPFGFLGQGGNLEGTNVTTGGHWNKTRDTTDVSVFTGRFDLTSQVNRFLQVKTGAELIASSYDVRSERHHLALGFNPQIFRWNRNPIQGAAYAQGKMEFKGMVLNVGLRLDYFDANTKWWVFEPYDQALRGGVAVLDELLPKADPKAKAFLSPRIGVSFPITENSKLYFNYGHFRQMLDPFQVFGIEETSSGGIDVIGFPEHDMPLTVQYELGFDQNLFDMVLLRVSGFYKDSRDQARSVQFNSLGGVVNYNTQRPWNYSDIRGAEISISKNRGRWFRGFINYTFLQRKGGNFGYSVFHENSFEMRNYLRSSTDYRQGVPIAEPYANLNLQFFTPGDYGMWLGNWTMNFLGRWRAGQQFIWTGGSGTFPELQENVQYKDYWMFDLRFAKQFFTGDFGTIQLFMDVNNVFNIKYLYQNAAFSDAETRDQELYMRSLHLPENTFDQLNTVEADKPFSEKDGLPYIWVPGDDKPGDFRKPGVPFQPIEAVASLDTADPNQIAWYWAKDTGTYSRWTGSAWEQVPDNEVKKVVDEKGYIDMPNFRFNTFLNPRSVIFGVRYTF